MLWGAGLGGLAFVIVAAAIFVSLSLSKRMALSRSETSPIAQTMPQTTPLHEGPTAPEQDPPSGDLPSEEPDPPGPETGPPESSPPEPRPRVPGPAPPERVPSRPEPARAEEPGPGMGGFEGPGGGLPDDAEPSLPEQAVPEGGIPGAPGGGQPGNAEPPAAEPEERLPPAEPGPLDDIRARDRFLVLPPPAAAVRGADPVELAKVLVDTPSECTLSVLGSDIVLGGGLTFVLECEDAEDGTRTWPVLLHAEHGLSRDREIGTFQMKDRSLTFAWKSMPPGSSKSARLRYCLLSVAVNGQNERCFLSKPVEIEPARIEFISGPSRAEIPLDAGSGPEAEHLRLDLQPGGFPRHEIAPPTGWKAGETGTIRVFEPEAAADGADPLLEIDVEADGADPLPEIDVEADGADPLLEIDVEFEFGDKCNFVYKTFGLETLESGGSLQQPRTQIGRSWLKSQKRKWLKRIRTPKQNQNLIQQQVGQLESRLKALEGAPARTAEARAVNLQMERELSTSLRVAQAQLVINAQQLQFYQSLEEWGGKVEKLFDRLEADGRLGFRIYVEIDGEEVEILRTKLEDSHT